MVANPLAFVVIIGDIVRSRRLSRNRRSTTQSRLKEVFVTINGRNKRTVITPLQFTAGDEFQGVLQNPGSAPLVIRKVREAIAPVSVRFGIGIGEISTPVSAEPQSMDGPAVHRARADLQHFDDPKSQPYALNVLVPSAIVLVRWQFGVCLFFAHFFIF